MAGPASQKLDPDDTFMGGAVCATITKPDDFADFGPDDCEPSWVIVQHDGIMVWAKSDDVPACRRFHTT
jgi:hypothetical protein